MIEAEIGMSSAGTPAGEGKCSQGVEVEEVSHTRTIVLRKLLELTKL